MATGRTSDLLQGVKEIAAYLRMTEKQAEHRIAAGVVPTFRLAGKGSIICARESSLDRWLDSLEGR